MDKLYGPSNVITHAMQGEKANLVLVNQFADIRVEMRGHYFSENLDINI